MSNRASFCIIIKLAVDSTFLSYISLPAQQRFRWSEHSGFWGVNRILKVADSPRRLKRHLDNVTTKGFERGNGGSFFRILDHANNFFYCMSFSQQFSESEIWIILWTIFRSSFCIAFLPTICGPNDANCDYLHSLFRPQWRRKVGRGRGRGVGLSMFLNDVFQGTRTGQPWFLAKFFSCSILSKIPLNLYGVVNNLIF